MPNIVRLTLGEPTRSSLMVDEIYVLETNLDDATGEVIGYTIDRMLQGGARDISVIPMTTKKNRPGHILKVITDRENVHPLTMLLMEETGTLGVRMYPSKRHILTRDVTSMEVKLKGLEGIVQVKVSRNREGRVIQVKPEFEDVRSLAEKTGRTLREIMSLVTDQARREIASH